MRVMRVLTRPNVGGPTAQAIALWHAHAALGVRTLLVTGRCGDDEGVLAPADGGVPVCTWEAANDDPSAHGWLELPDLGRGLRPGRDRRAFLALRQLLRRWRPDVLHTHTSKAGALGRLALRRGGPVRIVHTFHGHVLADYFGGIRSFLLRRLERWLARRADVLVAVSPSCAEELAAFGVAPRARLHVVPPAVALPPTIPRAQARVRLGLPPEAFVVGTVGRLVPIKRVDHVLQALASDPSWHGCVLGDGPLRAGLEQLATRLAIPCTFAGNHRDAAALLTAFDVLVLCGRREGLPLAAVEAFAAGVPVVGYAVPGITDALGTSGAGILVPPDGGPEALARAVAALRADPDTRRQIVAAAARSVPGFSPAAVARRLLDLYRGD